MKKTVAFLLVLCMLLSALVACTPAVVPEGGGETPPAEDVTIRAAGMKGPTSLGLVKLMEDAANGAFKTEKYTFDVKTDFATGLKDCKKMLMMAKAGKRNGYLLEGMACPGGCVAGAGTIRPIKDATLAVEKFKNDAAEMSCASSPYLDQLPDVEEFEKLEMELFQTEAAERAAKAAAKGE